MTKTRFTQWVVLVCIGALAGCTTSEDGTAGNTELNVIVPNGTTPSPLPTPDGNNGSTAPGYIDIQGVEYTINCLGTPSSFLDGPTALPNGGAVTLNGNLEVVDGRTDAQGPIPPEFGTARPGDGAEIWQGFMDLPVGQCSIQLRARDYDGEIFCTATENFTVVVNTTSKVNLVLICDTSFQAPVGMLDVDATFSFVVGNFCPSLYVLNCNPQDENVGIVTIPGFGDVAAAGCQVRASDVDSTCGENCDPQYCPPTAAGFGDCFYDPDGDHLDNNPAPALKTTVICTPTPAEAIPGTGIPGAIMDCNIDGAPDFVSPGVQGCVFNGDIVGTLGQQLPSALNPGEGGYAVAFPLCTAAFQGAGLCTTIGEPLAPGATMTCVATTTDGDLDCNKTKSVTLTGPGLSPCAAVGCAPGVDCAYCDDGIECSTDTCNSSTGSAVCVHNPRSSSTACSEWAPAGGLCNGTDFTCEIQGCNSDADCPAGNPAACTDQAPCNLTTLTCEANPPGNVGGTCTSGSGSGDGTCNASGTCVSNDACTPATQAVDCGVNANECLLNSCNTGVTPYVCQTTDNNGASCNSGAGICQAGVCELPPVVGVGSGSTSWRAEPTTGSGCTYDSVTTTCSGCTAILPLVPGGGQCAQFGTPVIHGCEVPGGVLNAQLAIDATVTIDIASTGDGNVSTGVTIAASNPALSTAAGLVTVDAATIFTSVTSGTPAQLTNGLNPAFAGQVLGFFTGGSNNLVLDGNPGTGPGVEILPATTPVVPASPGPTLFDYDTFSLTLTITASGTPLIVDDAGCVFNFPGTAVSIANAP